MFLIVIVGVRCSDAFGAGPRLVSYRKYLGPVRSRGHAAAPRGCAGAGGCAFFLIHEAHIPPPQERGHDSARGVPCGNETGTNGAKILSVRYFMKDTNRGPAPKAYGFQLFTRVGNPIFARLFFSSSR